MSMGADLKFIHCSDLHLGRRFTGVSDSDPALGKRLRESTFISFKRIVDLAISEKADLMVISGDIFDEENETPSTRHRFASELERLKMPCFISLGNHDFKRSWEQSIPYPPNVHVFSGTPESVRISINGNTVEIVGRSFSSKHTTENLAASLKGSPDLFTIAVVHCSADQGSDDDRYAPCKHTDLLGKNVDYWALGHIHKRSVLYENPHIVYSGNIQGTSSKESGEKGAYVVNVRNGSVSNLKFIPTQDILWQDISADITGKTLDRLLKEIVSESKKGSILSLRIKGRGDELDRSLRLHTKEFTEQLSALSDCVVSSIDIGTRPEIEVSKLEKNDLIYRIAEVSEVLSKLPREELIHKICSAKTSSDIRSVFEKMSDEELHSMITDAEMMIIEKLSEGPQ